MGAGVCLSLISLFSKTCSSGGVDEAFKIQKMCHQTLERAWQLAQVWLYRELAETKKDE